MTGGETPNLVFKKENGRTLKAPPLKKISTFEDWKKTAKLMQKRKLRINPMIENLKDELYQLENKQAKGAKLRANIS